MDLTMRAMARRLVAILALLLLAGCGSGRDPLPSACLVSGTELGRALDPAPNPVALRDGTRLSACLERASSDGELQSLGVALTTVAGRLQRQAPRDPAAAARLGYLIGAVRRGAAESNGVSIELGRRLERTGLLDAPHAAAAQALQRGLRAGARTG